MWLEEAKRQVTTNSQQQEQLLRKSKKVKAKFFCKSDAKNLVLVL